MCSATPIRRAATLTIRRFRSAAPSPLPTIYRCAALPGREWAFAATARPSPSHPTKRKRAAPRTAVSRSRSCRSPSRAIDRSGDVPASSSGTSPVTAWLELKPHPGIGPDLFATVVSQAELESPASIFEAVAEPDRKCAPAAIGADAGRDHIFAGLHHLGHAGRRKCRRGARTPFLADIQYVEVEGGYPGVGIGVGDRHGAIDSRIEL